MLSLINFLKTIFEQRYLIMSLAKRQIKTQFVGSLLGFVWTFINPLALILIFWFVFSVGLKTRPLGDIPFAVWFTAGLAIWISFSEIVTGSVNVIIENQVLIKKTAIKAHVLQIAKIVAATIPHLIFLVILIILILLFKLPFRLYYIQALYYFFCMCMLSIGLGWLLSAINVFIRDTALVVNMVMQFLFWLTPIVWDVNIMPKRYEFFLKLNPVFYLVQGYRESFFYFVPFWGHWKMTIYYWVLTGVIFVVGATVFRKTRPHFADVL